MDQATGRTSEKAQQGLLRTLAHSGPHSVWGGPEGGSCTATSRGVWDETAEGEREPKQLALMGTQESELRILRV